MMSRKYIFHLFIFLGSFVCSAQSKTELEKEKERLSREIKANNELLNEVKKDKESSIGELNVLDNQVKNREKLIENFSKQLSSLKNSISKTNNDIKSLGKETEKLKAEYAEMIRYAYKTRDSYDVMVFLFAAKNFNDAYKRLKYIRYYNDYRQEKVKQIQKNKEELSAKLALLESHKQEQASILQSEKAEKEQLILEKSRTAEIVKKLSGQESDLRKKIAHKKAEIERLDKEIKQIIALEIAKKKEAAKSSSQELSYTPEDTRLSSSFSANKGKLPWPLEKGSITQGFGTYSDRVHKDVKFDNNGLNISTIKKAKARAVFDGTVISIIYSPSFQYAIIISHGSFFSVYSNVTEVLVKSGDKVNTKQSLGTVFTDSEENKTELHFEIWREKTPEDPESWIKRL